MLYSGKSLRLDLDTAKRIANRLKREVVLRGPFREITKHRHARKLAKNERNLPRLQGDDLALVTALGENGAIQRPIASLGIPGTEKMLASLDVLAAELRALPVKNQNAPRLPISRLMELPEIYLWGLEPKLLDIVERYIGLPVHYHGADLRREIADGQTNDVRQWHIDAEDHRMFKIIAYLNDVTEVGGPFEYMALDSTKRAAKRLSYVSGFVPDDRMTLGAPRADWRMAVGPKHTANIADTCAVFHRAKPPAAVDRYSVTFSWMSRTPMKTYASMPMSEATYSSVTRGLSTRQRACVPPRTPL